MSLSPLFLLSHDTGLLAHWQRALANEAGILSAYAELQTLPDGATVWLDSALPGLPALDSAHWAALTQRLRIALFSSRPQDAEARSAIALGCVAYGHAYADTATLQQVHSVITAGNVWVGQALLQALLGTVAQASKVTAPSHEWAATLTDREREVAILAANAASNRQIADQCGITERTVKAHLATVFQKLNLTDRLQLALRVHGIS